MLQPIRLKEASIFFERECDVLIAIAKNENISVVAGKVETHEFHLVIENIKQIYENAQEILNEICKKYLQVIVVVCILPPSKLSSTASKIMAVILLNEEKVLNSNDFIFQFQEKYSLATNSSFAMGLSIKAIYSSYLSNT